MHYIRKKTSLIVFKCFSKSLPLLSSVGGLQGSTTLPSCDQTQLLDKSVSLTSSWEQFHPEHKKNGEEESNKDVANNKMYPAFDSEEQDNQIYSNTLSQNSFWDRYD